jgi:hypothetical protein
MRELLSKKRWTVDLGPEFQSTHDGSLQEDSHTRSRNLGIEALAGSRPWANTVDLEIFLQGFDWGERYALDKCGIRSQTEVEEPLETPHPKADEIIPTRNKGR